MSKVNLSLQVVALAREQMPQDMEKEASKCNSLKMLRQAAERNFDFQKATLDSIAPVKILLTDIKVSSVLSSKCSRILSTMEYSSGY